MLGSRTFEDNIALSIGSLFLHGALLPFERNHEAVQIIVGKCDFQNFLIPYLPFRPQFSVKYEYAFPIKQDVFLVFSP